MKSIKLAVWSVCLTLGTSLSAQSIDTLSIKRTTLSLYTPNRMMVSPTLDLKSIDFTKGALPLSLYNGTTQMYDTYVGVGDEHVYGGSSVSFNSRRNPIADLLLGTDSFLERNPLLMQNPAFFSGEDYRVRDSFNPYGASTLGEALFGGVLGLLFN